MQMRTANTAYSATETALRLLAIPDRDGFIVVAANFGKSANPAWYHNLRAHPQAWVAVDGVTRAVEARELTGAERDRHFRRAVAIYPGFEQYRRWAGRPIPVLRLEPRS